MKNKETHWFSHNKIARSHHKLRSLLAERGPSGYGQWWILMEVIRCQEGYKYHVNDSLAYAGLALDLMCTPAEAEQFVNDCVNKYKLLATDGEYIWSDTLIENMQHLDNKRAALSERGKKGAAVSNAKRWSKNKDGSSAQVNLSEKDLSQDVSYNTIPDNTIEKNKITTTIKQQFIDPQQAKEALLKDERFLYHYLGIKQCTQEQLSDWLDTFNKKLAIAGDEQKTLHDYRTHFMNWFKFRDPAKENPKTFLQSNSNKAPTVIPAVTSYMKTPAQLIKEQEEAERMLMAKAIGK